MSGYHVQIIGAPGDVRAEAVADAVAAEISSLGLHRHVPVAVSTAVPPATNPSVAVFFAGAGADLAALDQALAVSRVVIPVVSDLRRFQAEAPQQLWPINGIAYRDEVDAARIARLALEEVGIEERRRRAFISHRREDGLGAAEQLHDALTHIGFSPFIDRFGIPRGAEVQRRIADALEDYAFVVFLETERAHESHWVFDEVDYALGHSMGILIVTWPGVTTELPGSRGLPRLQLAADEVQSDSHGFSVLSPAALDRVLGEIEAAHAHALVRRRRMLVRSVEESATAAGGRTWPLVGWRVRVERDGTETIVGTSPRLPTAHDLQALDEVRVAHSGHAEAVLVHSARALEDERRAHLSWVTGERKLILTPENAIGAHWR